MKKNASVEDFEKYGQPSFIFLIAYCTTSLSGYEGLHEEGFVPGGVPLSMGYIRQLEKEQYFIAEILTAVKWK